MITFTVSADLVTAFLEYALSRGAARSALLAAARIDEATIVEGARIPLSAHLALVRAAAVACGDPAIALHYGVAVACAQQSVVGSIGATAPTPFDAVAQLNRFARLNLDVPTTKDGDRFALRSERGALWMIDQRAEANASPEITESTFARFATSLRRLSARPALRRVHVTHPPPPHAAEYDVVFGVPVHFAAERNALELEPWWATVVLPTQPRYLRSILVAHAERELAALDARATWRGRVDALLRPRLGARDIGIGAIARELGMSRQTLFRRLQAEGTSFAALVDEVRRSTALALVGEPGWTVKQIAARTGFSDPAAFSRAFRRWTGHAPGGFRARSASDGPTPSAQVTPPT
ncbi:MAG: AraC family transcriptional regulator [Gemmatimonadaceae bacterium]|nr:AraC family transcriptional regulator [Gemmatimonadaceae bacterium]